jgi:segregation and condensation protein B
MNLDQKIEAILFFRGESVSLKKIATILEITPEEAGKGIEILKNRLQTGALTIVTKDDEIMLATRPEAAPLIESLVKEELSRDLGKAGLETLSIVLYKGLISRREIDYIRGVNSQFILRNLLIRGLVEKITDKKDERRFLYRPTFELLQLLGVSSISELPEYTKVQDELTALVKKEDEEEKTEAEEITEEKTNQITAQTESETTPENGTGI